MKGYTFRKLNYGWFPDEAYCKAYDIKQARKKMKKWFSDKMSVPCVNSYIKKENIKIKCIEIKKL